MPSKRRILLCRLSFIVVCVLPTLIVATGIILPNRRQPWEDRIVRELGLQATIGQVDRPRPGTTVLGQVEIFDPEFGAVARLHAVEVQDTSKVLSLRLIHPEVRADRIDLLHRAIQQHILRRPLLNRRIEISCAQLTLTNPAAGSSGSGPVATLEIVACRIAQTAKGCELDLRFLPPAVKGKRRCQIRIEREFSAETGVSVEWTVDTNDGFVPCEVLSALLPALAHLGSECNFRGSIKGNSNQTDWNGTVAGQFSGVDMYRLVQDQFPHTFAGLADVQLVSLEIRDSKVVRVTGRLRSERGTIGRSLIEAAADELGCGLASELSGTATRYRAIDIGFDVSAAGVVVTGNCPARPGTMIEGQYGEPLLVQPDSPRPLAALARMLVPQSDVQVPLTRETSKLLSLFPIPSLEKHQAPGTPRTTLRLE